MTRLIVAAGGGGDAVASVMVDRALYGGGEPAVVLTYAWDRLVVDPVPGPRGPGNFSGLLRLTPNVHAVPADARPIAPAGSTLPRLAAELAHTFALIDPHHGAEGIIRQIEELILHLDPTSIDVVDVGGDILARGDEPTLRSPLGDALTLAACAQASRSIRLLVTGPGLDGEVPAADLRERLGPTVLTLVAEDVEPISGVLEWHPSEATAMLAATALGVRGMCDTQSGELPVPLTDEGPTVHEVDLDDALGHNRLAMALRTTAGLAEAEQYSREICGRSEIDSERRRSAEFSADQPPGPPGAGLDPDPGADPGAALARLAAYEADARGRGITHATFGRLAEALDLGATRPQALALREFLAGVRPEHYDRPLWRVPDRSL
jgi:hypothetical protein